LAPERAPRAEPVAVGEDRVRRRPVEDVVLAQAEPAAEAAGALGVGPEREAADPHRVVALGLLDRRVLGVLPVGLHRVGVVPAGTRSGSAGSTARKSTSTSRSCVSQPPTTAAGQRQFATVPSGASTETSR